MISNGARGDTKTAIATGLNLPDDKDDDEIGEAYWGVLGDLQVRILKLSNIVLKGKSNKTNSSPLLL